jgi:hypothetical protein
MSFVRVAKFILSVEKIATNFKEAQFVILLVLCGGSLWVRFNLGSHISKCDR